MIDDASLCGRTENSLSLRLVEYGIGPSSESVLLSRLVFCLLAGFECPRDAALIAAQIHFGSRCISNRSKSVIHDLNSSEGAL